MHPESVMSEEDILREIASTLVRPKSRSEMLGEFLCEIGVLLLVFALDAFFSPEAQWWGIALLACLAVAAGYVGMRIEEGRR